jgi:hypothetical protein
VDQESEAEAEADRGDSQGDPDSVAVQEWTLDEVGEVVVVEEEEEETEIPDNLDVRKKI